MHPTDGPLRWRGLCLPKNGHTDEEYEDAWAVDPAAHRFAMADGASESAFAALWARVLVEGFVAANGTAGFRDRLRQSRRRWSAEVKDLSLPWYAEMKRDEGAFATLLGLTLRPPLRGRPGAWRAIAAGDTCLVRVRGDRHVRSFPLKTSSEFHNDPCLIGSQDSSPPTPKRASGSMLAGDRFYLMTDALAQWFLRAHEDGERPCDAVKSMLSSVRPEESFVAWIHELRDHDGLRNDDVSLIAIAINQE
jgi:hypothetical protein